MEAATRNHDRTVLLGSPGLAEIANPAASRLGPDPEPLGVRAEVLMLRSAKPRRAGHALATPGPGGWPRA